MTVMERVLLVVIEYVSSLLTWDWREDIPWTMEDLILCQTDGQAVR
jgi:hypothetical protein